MNLDSIRPYAKAVVAFVSPGVASLVVAVSDASQGGSAVTVPEWVAIVAACVLTSGAVYAVPNSGRPGRHTTGYHSGVGQKK